MKKYILYILWIVFSFSCTKENDNNPGTSVLKDTVILNVAYGDHPRQVFDIHLPAQRDTSTPVIFMIHGGGWKAGQKEELNYYVSLLKAKWKNAAIVNLNYRLASNVNNIHHDEIMADINQVVTQVFNNRKNYVISSKYGIVGASAGGQLAMIYALKYNNSIKCIGNIFGPSIISDWEWYNSSNPFLGGLVGDVLTEYVGQPWNKTVYDAVSPYWNVSSSSQPLICFHGNLDPVVPVYQSQWMRNKLNDLKVPNQYHEYVAFHSFDNAQSDDVMNKLVAFFQTYLK